MNRHSKIIGKEDSMNSTETKILDELGKGLTVREAINNVDMSYNMREYYIELFERFWKL